MTQLEASENTAGTQGVDWKAVRLAAGLSIRGMANRVGAGPSSIRRFEAGLRMADLTRTRLAFDYRKLAAELAALAAVSLPAAVASTRAPVL